MTRYNALTVLSLYYTRATSNIYEVDVPERYFYHYNTARWQGWQLVNPLTRLLLLLLLVAVYITRTSSIMDLSLNKYKGALKGQRQELSTLM